MASDCSQGITLIADVFDLLQPNDCGKVSACNSSTLSFARLTVDLAQYLESKDFALAFRRLPSKPRQPYASEGSWAPKRQPMVIALD